jgi:glycosyltransferase involved in cell wall biosynthesis
MKISIVIATYYRQDGKTSEYLRRALDSIFNQTHQDFKIYLIGDRYEESEEIEEIVSLYDNEKLYFKNLDVAKERDFHQNKYALWSYGGVNAANVGIDISLSEGNEYICRIDHDDHWTPNHLEMINKCIEETGSVWMCTKSAYVNNRTLPNMRTTALFIDFLPSHGTLIHSSVCMNFAKLPFRYRDIYGETGQIGLPADADLWHRCRSHIQNNGFKSTFINQLTCIHSEEGYARG